MKPWFRQPEKTFVSATLRVDQFGTQLRPDGTPHGTKMIKLTPNVLTNSGIVGEENSQEVKLISMSNKKRKTQLGQLSQMKSCSPCEGMSFIRSYQILAVIEDKIEAITKMKTLFTFHKVKKFFTFKSTRVWREQHMAVIHDIRVILKKMCFYAQNTLKILDSKM